jgi:hypothetical protein
MEGRSVGLGLIALGLVVAVVCAAADLIGLGPNPGFGLKQISGTAAGIVIAGLGAYLARVRTP